MTILLEITNEPNLIYGSGMILAGAAGGLIKGIGSLFGRKKKIELDPVENKKTNKKGWFKR